jgi:Flp pilus assembly protein TadD
MKSRDKGGAIPGPAADAEEPTWSKEQLESFIKGEVTLAELEGIDGESQQKVAQLGYRLLTAGRLADARALFEGLVALNPKEPYFLLAAGAVAQKEERWDDAERWYSLALDRAPEGAVALANRGEVRVMKGDIDGAAPDLMAAVKQDPQGKEPTTQRARGLLLEIKRQLDEARTPAKKAPAKT